MPQATNILVFRKRLLAYSETFIADQGKLLPRMKASFCGYEWDDSGRSLLNGSSCEVLQDFVASTGIAKLRLRNGLGFNNNWLSAIRQHDPALIHAHFFKDGMEAIRLANKLSIPVMTTLHGHDITKTSIGSTELKQFFDRTDRVIAVSEFIKNQALARGCPEDKIIQHYIGIDVDRFDQLTGPR